MESACRLASTAAAVMAPVSSIPPTSSSLSFRNSLFFSSGSPSFPLISNTITSSRIKMRSKRSSRNYFKCMFGLGVPELAVIAGVVVLVFGPKKLPEVGKSLAKTVKSFQQAAKEFETEIRKDPDDDSEPPATEETEVLPTKHDNEEVQIITTIVDN